MIDRYQKQYRVGLIDLRYFDAAGFSLEPSIPYAWQPIGETICVPSAKSQRFSVLGFLSPDNQLFPVTIKGSVDSAAVIACFDAFSETISKKTVVLIDNAPVHTSYAFIASIRRWVSKGLIIKFLPPYSPQMNLIEILWRMIKYKWLPFGAYLTFSTLFAAVENILSLYGTEYSINFHNS